MSGDPLAPTTLEILAGSPIGPADAPALPPPRPGRTAREALESAVAVALERQPCLVTFSGGRDSSAVLAVAIHVARREGLPLPVPITVRFSNAPGAGEPRWQELVIAHLGLGDWEVIELGDELDLLGPAAQRNLLRHGVRYPSNCALYSLLLERARGGSLLTGFGGDQMLEGSWRTHWAHVARSFDRPRLHDLGALGYLVSPRSVRRALRRYRAPRRPWLLPPAQAELDRLYVEGLMGEPGHAGRHLEWLTQRRGLAVWNRTFELLASDAGTLAVHPLFDRAFVAALAREGGWAGFKDRTSSLRVLCGDLLPAAVIERQGKAVFPYAFFRNGSRSFASSWSGAGLDPELVDPEALREAWLGLVPSGYALLALQAAWLASVGGEREQEIAGRRQRVEAPGAPQLPGR